MTREEQATAKFEREFENILEAQRRQDDEVLAFEDAYRIDAVEVVREMDWIAAHEDAQDAKPPDSRDMTSPEARFCILASHRFVLRA